MQTISLSPSPSSSALPPPVRSHKSAHKDQRTKPDRACDFCRKRKTKCTKSSQSTLKCANCVAANVECTYLEASKPRGPPKRYVQDLEDRVERTERLIQRLRPDFDLVAELGPRIERDSWKTDADREPQASSRSSHSQSRSSGSPEVNMPTLRPNLGSRRSPPSPSSDSDSDDQTSDHAPNFPYNDVSSLPIPRVLSQSHDSRYHGKSSQDGLVRATIAVKKEYADSYPLPFRPAISQIFRENDIPENEWKSWQDLETFSDFNFPPQDLAESLIEVYFTQVNTIFPLLHRPTFVRQFQEGLHYRDRHFAAVLFSLLATASRWSDDPRVRIEGAPELSSGWKFILENFKVKHSFLAPPSLFDLQNICLLSMFFRGSILMPVSWNLTGVGLRLAQDVGAHRKRMYKSYPNAEDELWKRAFWILIVQDRIGSATLGRPCCARDEDHDLDLPLEVDDEYWERSDHNLAFKQPAGKPSVISGFNTFIKLTNLMEFTIRTIYCIDKSKVLLGLVGPNWRESVVEQLNTAMEEWTASIPPHVRWGPDLTDPTFSNQSATLYTTYYLELLLIYRPFIPPLTASSHLDKKELSSTYPFPALAICTSAARAGVRVLETQWGRGASNVPNLLAAAHLCGAILVMKVWQAKKEDRHADTSEWMSDIQKCLRALEVMQNRWYPAGPLLKSLRDSLPEPEDSSGRMSVPSGVEAGQEQQVIPKVEYPADTLLPSGFTDHPHERAMQPPQETPGWHWFNSTGSGFSDNRVLPPPKPKNPVLQPQHANVPFGNQQCLPPHSHIPPAHDVGFWEQEGYAGGTATQWQQLADPNFVPMYPTYEVREETSNFKYSQTPRGPLSPHRFNGLPTSTRNAFYPFTPSNNHFVVPPWKPRS
ncbi:hypothetical protein SISNIDRAFT_481356 [Sistotremastrum niveocremeum HHB9708]|uniref:Zn(2)-C6 fungal-type domain-containing protein n=1 Tax=Sistotremastrum niveocremeum HHB9708 TaxID=1314777 RepID=A0A165A918_9AGAM|nr:hypothetical protein SISNIDRAFT_481356 [Sistotremastrum niveocremeum HHB9708]